MQFPHTPQFYVHVFFMGFAWTFLMPLAITISRFAKRFYHPLWFKLHRGMTAGALGLIIGAWILGMTLMSTDVSPLHLWVGTIAVFLAALQPTVAWFRPSAVHGDKPSADRREWFFCHAWIGRISVVLGLANVAIGLSLRQIGGTTWVLLVTVPLGLIAATYCVCEWKGLHKNLPMKRTRRVSAASPTPGENALLLPGSADLPRMRVESMRLDTVYLDDANKVVRRDTEILDDANKVVRRATENL